MNLTRQNSYELINQSSKKCLVRPSHIIIHNNNKYIITIGKNAIDNWKIIDDAESDDIWCHLENMPSSHVIIHSCDKKEIMKDLIYQAAIMCKKHSKSSKVKNVNVIYTMIKNVKKANDIGSVTTTCVKRIVV